MAYRLSKENRELGYNDRDVRMNTARSSMYGSQDIYMATAKSSLFDVRMDTAKSDSTIKKAGLKAWEREIVDSPEVIRKATVAQLCNYSII
jgi:cell cycle protein kinase DBF2